MSEDPETLARVWAAVQEAVRKELPDTALEEGVMQSSLLDQKSLKWAEGRVRVLLVHQPKLPAPEGDGPVS